MTEKFNGFTDSDINRIVRNEFSSQVLTQKHSKKERKTKPNIRKALYIPEEAKLSITNEVIKIIDDKPNEIVIQLKEKPVVSEGDPPTDENPKIEIKEELPPKIENQLNVPKLLKSDFIENITQNKITDTRQTIVIPDLDEFEEKRKQLEGKNAQAKKDLQKALDERAKKTKEETKKLNQIEAELREIDAELSNDIAIIRNQIESTSLNFMEAQKRFDRAEKEYNIALADLMKVKEKKMLLTSHLCSIIEQNELKKAQKLSDLMEKLELKYQPTVSKSEVNSPSQEDGVVNARNLESTSS